MNQEQSSGPTTLPPIRWSDNLARILGLEPANTLPDASDFINRFVHQEDRQAFAKNFRLAAVTGQGYQMPLRLVRANGQVRYVRAIIVSILDESQKATHLVGAFHDLSELQELEKRALRDARLAAIREFSSGLAHETGNALQRSQACLEMLADLVRGQGRAMHLVARIQDAQDHLIKLYEKVREYAAPLKLNREPVGLKALLNSAWKDLQPLHSGCNPVLQVMSNGYDGNWSVDAAHMQRVLHHLLDNALAASLPSPCIRASFSIVPGDPRHLRLSIRDNGPGLTVEQRQRLFTPFFTTKAHAVGLGLALATRIVEEHGGTIELGSKADEAGAEFIVSLPEVAA